MKTYLQCCDEVAKKYDWADNEFIQTIINEGNDLDVKIFKEATILFAKEKVKETVKLARQGWEQKELLDDYTEQEILEKLKL